jgi:PAS domain S-box-containing protein
MLYQEWEKAAGVAEHLPVGILQTDPRGRCVALNSRAGELLRLSREQALGEGWLAALDEEARAEVRRRWGTAAAGDSPLRTELRLPQEGGLLRILSCRVIPLRSEGGFVRGYLATLLDVTEWHRTERDLRRATRELEFRVRELDCLFEISRAVERSAGDLGAILRETVGILARTWGHAHPACARIVLEGQVFQTANYVRSSQAHRAPILLFGEAAGDVEVGPSEPASRLEVQLSSAEAQRLLEAVAQRLGRTTERVKGRRLLREKEEEMRERLTHLTRVSTMGEMASSIAHEVNQPLTAIATYAQACRRLVESGAAGPGEVLGVLGRISEEALRAGNIVHRLKDMVRRQETRWTECDLNALVRDIEQLASVDARLHDVALRLELAPELPPILADGVQIQQVVLNLIRNGIDAVEEAAPALREVVVRTGMAGHREVRVSVEDAGCGLPADLDEKLFHPFFTTKKGGMGMGLSICKSIATSHRGRITYARNTPHGMTFHFILPILDDA